MTQNGTAYRLPVLVRLTDVIGFSSLPTPNTLDHTGTGRMNKNGNVKKYGGINSLGGMAATGMWPTPTTQEIEHPDAILTKTGRRLSKDGKSSHSLNLADSVKLWPTPQASDHRDRGHLGNPCIQRRKRIGKQLSLSQVVSQKTGKLNPTWVEWLMGFPLNFTEVIDCDVSETQ
jgi:hypothetical protein